MPSSVRLAFHPWSRPQTLNLPNRRVRTRTHGGVGGGSCEASPYPDMARSRSASAWSRSVLVCSSITVSRESRMSLEGCSFDYTPSDIKSLTFEYRHTTMSVHLHL